MGLIENGLVLLQTQSYPVYMRNIDRRDPPFAHGEFTPAGIAVLLLATGLDYHLARLKYLRDYAPNKPPLPYTPYFNWKIGDSLSFKVERLLTRRNEITLKKQLLELTVLRDSIAHPKLYVVREIIRSDLSFGRSTARLPVGELHQPKALKSKLARSERTRCLRFPLVPTWISYKEAVMCIMVANRFLNLLERKYGNPYAWVGGFSLKNEPAGFFTNWGTTRRRSIPFDEWTRAFFNSLSSADQELVEKRLGGNITNYLHKSLPSHRRLGRGRITDILRFMQKPPKPKFLRKPPP